MRQLANPASWRQRGVSLFEVAVVAIIVAVLAGVLLQRLTVYRDQAELAAAERTVSALRASLTLQIAQLRMQGRSADIDTLAGKNPMDWLREKPGNYAGELFDPAPADVQAGNWYFDRKTHILVYRLNNANKFPQGIPNTLKYKVKFIGLSQQIDRSSKPGAPRDLALIQVDK